MQDVRDGSPRGHAWAELLAFVERVVEVLLRRHGSPLVVNAGDITQDVLLQLYKPARLRRLRASKSPEGYIVVMVRNRIYDYLRRDRLRQRSAERPSLPPEPLPLVDVLSLHEALRQLSEEEQELIRLRFWERRPFQEIADELGLTYSAAAVRLFRLLKKLRDLLDA